ncbi:MAG: hypothetical protein HYT37_00565 [Candidatus Sungbacteria bacterium]|nr:hypothetical protein [Candidatus Sungbacteria bacterium]
MNKDTARLVEVWKKIESGKKNKFVSIDYDNIERCVIDNFVAGKTILQTPDWRIEGALARHDWVFAANSIVINALNFAFNIFEKPDTKYRWRKSGFSGSLAMAERFYHLYGERIIQAHDIARLNASHMIRTKYFLDGEEAISLRDTRTRCLINIAEVLEEEYGGSPLNLLEDALVWDEERKRSVWYAFHDGKGLVELLIKKFPIAYGDAWKMADGTETYTLKFNKKAQLVALLLYGRGKTSYVLPPLVDINEVGQLTDYQVPNALHARRILRYNPVLAAKIDNWQEINAGSREELEIRLATTAACVELLDQINKCPEINFEPSVTLADLDYWLWVKGKQSPFRPHLVRTSAY